MVKTSNWTLVDAFTVNQAAALWCDVDPATLRLLDADFPSEVAAIKQMLSASISANRLHADHSSNSFHIIGDYSKSQISRSDLEEFANAKGQRPAFLFDTFAPFDDGRPPGSLSRKRSAQVADPKRVGGRPTEYDWDSFAFEIIHRANSIDGLPDTQAELIRNMLEWFRETYDAEPAESSIKARISRIYRYLAEAKN